MTKNLIVFILMRRNMIPLDIQLTYTNIVLVDLLFESFKYMKYCHFLFNVCTLYSVHTNYSLLKKGVL